MESNRPGFLQSVKRFFSSRRYEICLFLLTISGFFLRLFVSCKEPFLHDWDERFHALVARNLMDHPFVPMLRSNPVDSYDRFSWCCNHIWLHKQPLFMWQMAISMKVFGVSDLAMRMPSIVMGSMMIVLTYRIAAILTGNKLIALLGATFLCFSHFHLEMISGIKGMDHNDVAMGFYVLASVWALLEYKQSPKWYWVVLIGLFSGCAILNKWLVGLFVFLCWGISILTGFRKISRKEIFHFVAALAVCCCVFVPWQIYIMQRWPAEAMYEYEFNRRHITEVLQGHKGSIWFYAGRFSSFLSVLWPVGLPGLLFALVKKYKSQKMMYSLVAAVLFVFSFFSFVVKTKVESHVFFVMPFCMIIMSIGIGEVLSFFHRWFISVPVFLAIAYLSLRPMEFKNYFKHDMDRQRKIHNTMVYKNLKHVLPEKYKVVMNLPAFEDVELMFYQNDLAAYHWCVNESDLKKLAEKKVPIAVFASHGQYQLPEYIKAYPDLFIIEEQLE